jgi:hypothetical protein
MPFVGPDDLNFVAEDMQAAILNLNDIPVKMGAFLSGVGPRITGLPTGFDSVTQKIAAKLNTYGASVCSVTVAGMAKIPEATTAYAAISEAYQSTDTQGAYHTAMAVQQGVPGSVTQQVLGTGPVIT